MTFAKKALIFGALAALGAGATASAQGTISGAGATSVPLPVLPSRASR